MKLFKRLSASSLIGAALAILFASNVAAAGYTQVSVWDHICHHSGGAHGYGYIALNVAAEEYGKSGVNQMQFTAVLQHRSAAGQSWSTIGTMKASTKYFANTSANRLAQWQPQWDYALASVGQERVVVTVKFLDLDAPTAVVAVQSVHGPAC